MQVSVHFRPESSQQPGQRPAHVHLYAPEQPHSGGWDQGWEVIVFHLSPFLLTEAAAELSGGGSFEIRPFKLGRDRVLEQMAHMVLREFRSRWRGGTFFVESIGHVVAGHILRTHAEILPRSRRLDALSAREVLILRQFIEDRIELGFTVIELAQCIAHGPQRFARKLQLATGLSPWRYVQAERISMARRMLKNPSIPLSDIASRLGLWTRATSRMSFASTRGLRQ